jgi:MYXO-CTERM domain-containing protein
MPLLALLTAIRVVAEAFAGAPPPVVNGNATHDYPEVVLVYATNAQGNLAGTCTGTLIARGAVLTAAHCLAEEKLGFAVGQVSIMELDALAEQSGGNTSTASGWTLHPAADLDSGVHDVALVQYNQSSGTAPIRLFTGAPSDDDLGRDYTIVGFGLTGETDTDHDLKKRRAEVPLADYDADFLYTWDESDQQNACEGDSGGPLFRVRKSDGAYALAGVMDWVSGCTGGSLASGRSDAQLAWIEGLVEVETVADFGDGPARANDDPPGDDGDGNEDEPRLFGCSHAAAPVDVALAVAALAALGRRRQMP